MTVLYIISKSSWCENKIFKVCLTILGHYALQGNVETILDKIIIIAQPDKKVFIETFMSLLPFLFYTETFCRNYQIPALCFQEIEYNFLEF